MIEESVLSSVLFDAILTVISVITSFIFAVFSISISVLLVFDILLYLKAQKNKNKYKILIIFFIVFSISASVYCLMINFLIFSLLKH